MINKILFDMDGVLVDAKEWHYEALNSSLQELYGITISREDHIKEYNGLPTRIKIAMLKERGLLPQDASLVEINNLKQYKTIQIIEKECKPDSEKLKIMNNLVTSGWTIGCVTNSIRLTTEIMLERSNLLQFMSVIICGDEVKKGKPDPESYIKARDQLKAPVGSVIVVEDSEYGIKSAQDAGCIVISVKNYEEVTWHNLRNQIQKLTNI